MEYQTAEQEFQRSGGRRTAAERAIQMAGGPETRMAEEQESQRAEERESQKAGGPGSPRTGGTKEFPKAEEQGFRTTEGRMESRMAEEQGIRTGPAGNQREQKTRVQREPAEQYSPQEQKPQE